MRKKILYTFLAMTTGLSSCNRSEEITDTSLAPVITFDEPSLIYSVKTGRQLTISPTVTNTEQATYRWLFDGQTVGREPSYTFTSDEPGQYYLTFEVTNPAAVTSGEIRIDVEDKLLPHIAMHVPADGFVILTGTPKHFTPDVTNGEEASYTWTVDGQKTADTREYTFTSGEPGEFTLALRADNEDGSDAIEFNVSVRDAADMPLSWEWETDTYNMTAGRTIVLSPLYVTNAGEALYTWYVDDTAQPSQLSPEFSFTPLTAGEYRLRAEMSNDYATLSHSFTVTAHENEAANKRPATAASSFKADKVYEFLPAPGQFVNEGYTATTMVEACAWAQSRLDNGQYVSLGAFGGYIVAGFDHSVENDGNYNIRIGGNAFEGSCEPGIVWVMQDENGDGQPNDTWYELKGSEHLKPETTYNYSVTYHRPQSDGGNFPWSDNLGGSGTVDRNNFHRQDYYPAWVAADSYTLRGTRLASRAYDKFGDGSYWVLPAFDWGYADNYGLDRLTDEDNNEANEAPNHFRISDAVDANGKPVHLDYIDFVKVQTAINDKAGWLGEVSTEVFSIHDYNMIKGK